MSEQLSSASEKRFVKYAQAGDCHWREEFGSIFSFNLVQHARYEMVLQSMPSHCGSLLDWGCGDGALSKHLLERCDRFVGVDTEEEGLKFFEKHLGQYRAKYALELLSMEDPYHLSYPDASFDVIVCSDVIEHVAYPEKLIAEFSRLLAPGGTVVITTPYRLAETPNDPMHVHEFYPSELTSLLNKQFPRVEIRLSHKIVYFSLYALQIRYRPVFRYLLNIAYILFRYNPFLYDQRTKRKWDVFTMITAIARR